jgi:putative peptidoglycan lipid II flippase
MKFFQPRTYRSVIGWAMLAMLIGKGISYVRQLLVAFYFGVSRDLDIYLMAFSIGSLMLIAPFTVWFDQILVPRLIQLRERDGESVFRDLGACVFTFSVLLSVGLAAGFVLLFPLFVPLMAHGFPVVEQARLRSLIPFFVPWILVLFPYCALISILKSLRNYNAVLLADLVVSVGSAISFWIWHPIPAVLPLTLAVGYLLALSGLVLYCFDFTTFWGNPLDRRMRTMYRNFLELFWVNQLGSISSMIDRFFQSYLGAGAISGLSYASQTLIALNDVITLDELYIVPLSSSDERAHKLERLLDVTILITVPLAILMASQAQNIVKLLYQRGDFNANARVLTASIFILLTANFVAAAVAGPLHKMFQILDRIHYSGILYAASALFLLILDLTFVFHFKLDVQGLALAMVGNSCLILCLDIYLVRRAGVDLRVTPLLKYFSYALVAGGLAAFICRRLPHIDSTFLNLALDASTFTVLTGLMYWPIKERIFLLFRGRR